MDKYRELREQVKQAEGLTSCQFDPSQLSALLAERDALERQAYIAHQMSNVMFNWKQCGWVPENYKKVMDDLVHRFDAAKRQEGVNNG